MNVRNSLLLGLLLMLGACEPQDRRPGLWLDGEVQAQLPTDWSFTNDHKEIFLEVATPYLLPHSVTIWCAEVDGILYVGARAPESKNWPGWVDARPEVSLEIDGRLYEVHLEPLSDPDVIARVAAAYGRKYNLSGGAGSEPVSQRYWRVGRG